MKIVESILTKNPCYSRGRKLEAVKGLMIHSVGCNQPSAQVFVKNWNSASYDRACVHAFIDGNTGDIYQCLPWDWRGWHCASGNKGSGNNTHIGVEMCEPSTIRYTGGASWVERADGTNTRETVMRTYKAAVELFAFLCNEYGLNPLADGVVISHSEGYKRGIASNHGDVEHLWRKFGLTMEQFRQDIRAAMNGTAPDPAEPEKTSSNAERIWDNLKGRGLNDYAVAGIMGNLYAESALAPDNLQNTYNNKLNMTDAEYTAAVDSGSYGNFAKDGAGYGLAQWTYWSRKKALFDFAKAAGKSIADLNMQLDFLWKEIQGYSSVMAALNAATSVQAAATAVLTGYEKPADQSEAVQKRRAEYGQNYYNQFAEAASPSTGTLYKVQVGAYKVKENAQAMERKLNAAGFETYIAQIGGYYKVQVGAYSVKGNAEAMHAKLKAAGYSDAFITTVSGSSTAPGGTIKAGSTVRLKQGAKTYKGGGLASFVYTRDHIVKEISGDRVVITYGGVVVAAVKLADLTLVKA